MSVNVGTETPGQVQYLLHDPATPAPRRAAPLVPALLIQALLADATADTVSITYSRQPHQFAQYQFASWTERPLRQVPRLLQRRLEARGVAGAVGLLGEPMRADWLLTIAIDTLHHDVSAAPSQGRIAITVELFDRRDRSRIVRQRFEAAVPSAGTDAPAGAKALSASLAQAFDALMPWLEGALQQAAAKAPR